MIEAVYGHGLFQLVRTVLDFSIGLLPFAFTYVIFGLVLLGILRFAMQVFRQDWLRLSTYFLNILHLTNIAGWVIFAFYWLWGFNYDRISLMDRLPWSPEAITKAAFVDESKIVLQSLAQIRSHYDHDIDQRLDSFDFSTMERRLREETADIASGLRYTVLGRIKCRQLKPPGILLRLSTAGFYNPFSGECNIDIGLHPLQKPFIMAHEFFHGMGVGGEGDCNFLAYVTCRNSDDPLIRYSGELAYWRYVRGNFRRLAPDEFKQYLAHLPEKVKLDLEEIDKTVHKYPDIMPKARDAFYDAYLRTNHMHDGMANYGKVVNYVMQWRKEDYRLIE